MLNSLSLDNFALTESDIVEDEYAAPSDIAWRIAEIAFYKTAAWDNLDSEDRAIYGPWLEANIENLLFVERGGV